MSDKALWLDEVFTLLAIDSPGSSLLGMAAALYEDGFSPRGAARYMREWMNAE